MCENTCGGFFFFYIMARKLTREEFIQRAKKIHGDKYDYSKVDYVNSRKEVCIICPEHGEFYQLPHIHLSGHGCSKCGRYKTEGARRKTTEYFVNEVIKQRGDIFSFEKTKYINNTTPVILTCKKHRFDFQRTPKDILTLKTVCPKCAKEIKRNTENFIEDAKKIHGNKYDYSKVEYKNNQTKVCIICPEHGEFWQRPNNHISSKHGCPKCGLSLNGLLHNKTTEYFIEKSKLIHGNKYDYSKTNYTKRSENLTIICPEHGEFLQRAGNHLVGAGCPQCVKSQLEESVSYLLTSNNIQFEYEKKFDWLKKITYLSIDFYLPEYNVAIECQGEQHYRPVKYFGGIEEYKRDVERDQVKESLLIEHGIKVFYFAKEKYRDDVIVSKDDLLNKILLFQ